jgi:hypothetical protein
MADVRTANVKGAKASTVARFLPSNYEVIAEHPSGVVTIQGTDSAGWTMEDYVLPRLASGMIYPVREDS